MQSQSNAVKAVLSMSHPQQGKTFHFIIYHITCDSLTYAVHVSLSSKNENVTTFETGYIAHFILAKICMLN